MVEKTPLKDREPTDNHVELAAYINDEHGVLLAPDTVALVLRAYPEFRKTEAAAASRAAAKESREREEQERTARRVARDRARLDKLEAEREKLLASLPPVVASPTEDEPRGATSEQDADRSDRFIEPGSDDEFVADSVDLTSDEDDEDF